MPKIFASPRPRPGEERRTYYQTFTGDATLFPGNTIVKLEDIKQQRQNLWLVAEAARSVEWTRPDDITANIGVTLGGIFDGDYNVLCLDGGCHYVRKGTLNTQQILQMVNPLSASGVAGWPPPR